MQIGYRGLEFTWQRFKPKQPGLYAAVSGNVIHYIGEAANIAERTGNPFHAGLNRAWNQGAETLLFSERLASKQDRLDFETLIRRDFKPPANEQPIPSFESCADAATRLGLSDAASQYRIKAIAHLLTPPAPPIGFADAVEPINALAQPRVPGSPVPINAFNTPLFGFGDLPLK